MTVAPPPPAPPLELILNPVEEILSIVIPVPAEIKMSSDAPVLAVNLSLAPVGSATAS